MKAILLVQAAAAALVIAPASAQTASTHAPAGDQAPTTSTSDTPNDPATSPPAGTGDIIVTATRRAVAIQDVPIAISNFGQTELDRSGVTDVRRLSSLSPSFNFTSSVSESYGAVIRVRGVGTSGSNPGLESATGVYVDGVYRNRAGLAVNDLPGLERVELLRGPQGTLFGKNTTAGVVNILTRRPSFTPEFQVTGTAGNYGLVEGRVSATGPIAGDTLAARFDGLVQHRDPIVTDYLNGQGYYNRSRFQLRGQLLYRPSDRIDVRIIADYTERHEDPGNGIPYRVSTPTASAVRVLTALGAAPRASFDAGDTHREVSETPGDFFDRGNDWGLSAELNWNLGFAKLTAISAYRGFRTRRNYDVEGNVLDLLTDPFDGERFRTFTQEVRLQGKTGALDYLIGGFYAHEQVISRDSYRFGVDLERYLSALVGGISFTPYTGLPAGQSFRANAQASFDTHTQTGDSLSVFTHNTLSLTDRLNVTGGLRYTTEKKSIHSVLTSDDPACSGAVALYGSLLAGVPAGLRGLLCVPNFDSRLDGIYNDSRSESQWSGTASADYSFADALHGYVSYSRGYKAGGYNLDRAGLAFPNPQGSNLRFNPEFADSYEAGLKGVFLDRRFRPNLAVFYSKFSDYQYTYNLLLPSGVPQRVTTNLPELVTKGVELETSFVVSPAFTLTANVTYQNARFGDSGFPVALAQLQNTQAPNAPTWLAAGSVSYDHDLGSSGLKLFAFADTRWQSRTNVSSSGAVTFEYFQGDYATVDARLGFGDTAGRWSVEVFTRNLFDKAAWTQLVPATLQSGAIYGYLNEPRYVGVTARSRF